MTVIRPNSISGVTSITAQVSDITIFGASSGFANITAGNISAAGTITYEDVTNVDSVGVITARSGIDVTSGNIALSSNGANVAITTAFDFKIRSNTAKFGLHIDNASGTPTLEFGIGGAQGADITTNSTGPIVFKPNNSERLRITHNGEIGIGGANYGTSGQVLTSQGASSAVQWATPSAGGAAAGNMFLAKMNGGYNTTNNTDGEIIFQAESFDLGSAYNHTNGRFTPNIAGYYFIDASLQFSTNSANNLFESTIWKNGTEQFKNRMWNDGANSELHCKISGIVTVNGSSDYISIAAWQNSGGNLTVNPGNGSYFTGFFLRSL